MTTSGTGTRFVASSDHDIERIARLDDPVSRNLWITQTYAELAERLLVHLHTDQTWCTFAIWASNTAGVSIRSQELPHLLDELLDGADHHVDAVVERGGDHPPLLGWLAAPLRHGHVETLVHRALGQVSEHIAHGNVLVYAELAPLFVRLVDHLDAHGPPPPGAVTELLDQLGVPSLSEAPLVHTAFRSYASAAATDDPAERAQLVLTANIAAVLHEQQRLQDDVAAALDAGLVDVGAELDRLVHRVVPGPLRRWLVRHATERVADHVESLWQHVATRLLMTMVTSVEVLHLGVDVPAPEGGPLFPTLLIDVDHPPLVDLMAQWDPTRGTGRGSAARDWASLRDRMGYIVNLFRSRQQVLALTAPPFTGEQLADLVDGRVPAGL